jgi:adenylate cyclase
MTVALTGSTFAWRELDVIRVQGRAAPVKIHELLAAAAQETPQQASAAAYAAGLSHWRKREFDPAAKCFARVAEGDMTSTLFLIRAKIFVNDPPGPDWESVNTLEGK